MASRATAAAVQERHGLAVSHVTVRAALVRASKPAAMLNPPSRRGSERKFGRKCPAYLDP
jgi:hypothetical protein